VLLGMSKTLKKCGHNLISSRNGQVAKGVLEILQQLPTVHVTLDDLPRLTSDPGEYAYVRCVDVSDDLSQMLICARYNL
jgi:hypothetical protein